MKTTLLIIATWVVTAAIAVFGVSAAATIWYYMEPVMASVSDPPSYMVAVWAGFVALLLSVVVSIAISVHLARPRREAAT